MPETIFCLECGIQSARKSTGVDGLGKMAALGDWPWHAALLKEGVHVCDATVVHPQWLLTSASCFQGYVRSQIILVLVTFIFSNQAKKIDLPLLSYFGVIFPHLKYGPTV